MSVRELHNTMVITPEEVVLKEARDEENNTIISDYIPRNILPPQLKKLYVCDRVQASLRNKSSE